MSRASTTAKITLGHIAKIAAFLSQPGSGVLVRHSGEFVPVVRVDNRVGTTADGEMIGLQSCTIHKTTLAQIS